MVSKKWRNWLAKLHKKTLKGQVDKHGNMSYEDCDQLKTS